MDEPEPVVVAEWPRPRGEVTRLSFASFAGKDRIDLRIWYRDGDGFKPGRAGVSLPVERLPELADAIALALGRAREKGLVPDGG